jgi:hypothetical protein
VTSLERNAYPKVLVAIPTYEGKDYIFNEMITAVMSFNYPNYDIIVIDNTKDFKYFLKLKRRLGKRAGILRHVERGENSRQALCNAQNLARQKMLDENYAYLLFVESDLIPPPQTIEKLMSHNVPVVGVTYFLGTTEQKVPCIFLKEYKQEALGMGTRLLKKEEIPEYLNHGLKRVHGTGLGTTLIRRDIMQKYYFWHDTRFNDKHSDVYFYMDLDNAGIPVFVDTDLIVPHYPSEWEKVTDK